MNFEFSEQQQAFHNNYSETHEDTNGYKTIFTGDVEELSIRADKIKKAMDIRDNGYLTFERAKEIINGK